MHNFEAAESLFWALVFSALCSGAGLGRVVFFSTNAGLSWRRRYAAEAFGLACVLPTVFTLGHFGFSNSFELLKIMYGSDPIVGTAFATLAVILPGICMTSVLISSARMTIQRLTLVA